MLNLSYQLTPLRSKKTYSVSLNDNHLTLRGDAELELPLNPNHRYLIDADKETEAVVTEALFAARPTLEQITINDERISRDNFYQSSSLWLRDKHKEETTLFPQRPPHFHGVHYQRFLPSINRTINFRTITLEDLDIFHEWHNQKRVAFFWELNQEKEEL